MHLGTVESPTMDKTEESYETYRLTVETSKNAEATEIRLFNEHKQAHEAVIKAKKEEEVALLMYAKAVGIAPARIQTFYDHNFDIAG